MKFGKITIKISACKSRNHLHFFWQEFRLPDNESRNQKMEIQDRLKLIRGGLKQEDFSGIIGVHKNTIGRWERGEQTPGFDDLNKILKARPQILPTWLLTGEGPMTRDGGGMIREQAAEYSSTALAGDEYVHLPLYDVRAAAGGGALVDREQILDVLAFKATWIRSELRANPADLYLIYVEGESMEPTLRPGDLILVDRSAAIRDGIFVIRIDEGLLVKRLQRLPGNQVKVTSDNPAYEPFTINLGNPHPGLAIIGRVVWSGRRM